MDYHLMAMSDLPSNTQGSNGGRSFYQKVTLSSGTESDAYVLPMGISSLGCTLSGDGAIEFTISPISEISDDTAVWEEWDGLSQVNNSVTAFRVTRSTGTVVAQVKAKTWE